MPHQLRPSSLAAALRADPACAPALFWRAALALRAGRTREALRDLEALEEVPAERFLAYGELAGPDARLYRELEPRLEALCRGRAPAFAFVLRAFARRARFDYGPAVADLERACAAAPRSAALRALLARVRFVGRFPERGLRELERAARLAPRAGWIRAWRGEALRQLGRPREALRALDEALALEPAYAWARAWRGGALRLLGRAREALRELDAAERALKAARRPDADLSWVYNERMLARRDLGDAGGALGELRRAHARNPRYAWSRGRDPEFMRRGEDELSRLLARRPRHRWARAWRGWLRLETGRPGEALADLRGRTAAGRAGAWTLCWRGRALAALGREREALAALDAALARDPRYAPAWAWRGALRRAAGLLEAARRDFDRAVALDPIAAWARAWRGELELSRGNWRLAYEDLEAALRIDPGNADAELWRAECSWRLGRPAEARRGVRRVLAARPESWRAWTLKSLLASGAARRRHLRRAMRLAPAGAAP